MLYPPDPSDLSWPQNPQIIDKMQMMQDPFAGFEHKKMLPYMMMQDPFINFQEKDMMQLPDSRRLSLLEELSKYKYKIPLQF